MATETKTEVGQPTLADYETRIVAQIEEAEARIAKFEERDPDFGQSAGRSGE